MLTEVILLPSPGQVFLPFFYCKTDMHPSELRVFKLSPTSFFFILQRLQKALWISYLEKYYELHAKDVSLEGIDLKKIYNRLMHRYLDCVCTFPTLTITYICNLKNKNLTHLKAIQFHAHRHFLPANPRAFILPQYLSC